MTQRTPNYDLSFSKKDQNEYIESKSYNETKELLSKNAFTSLNENGRRDTGRREVAPGVPPRNFNSRRVQSMYIDSSKFQLSNYGPSNAKLSYTQSPDLSNTDPIIPPQTQNSTNSQYNYNSQAPPTPQRQTSMLPQPPVHNSNGLLINTRNSICLSGDLQNQYMLSQPSPKQLSHLYQMNRQIQNPSNDNSNTNYSKLNQFSPIKQVRTSSLPVIQYNEQYNTQIRNPNPLPPNQFNNQNKPNYRYSIAGQLPTYNQQSTISRPLPSPQNSSSQKSSPEYNQISTLPSPMSPAQNQIIQNHRPLPSNPQSSVTNESSTTRNENNENINENNNNNGNNDNNNKNNVTPLSAPTRITSMMSKPSQQYAYRSQTLSNGLSQPTLQNQHTIYKSYSTSQLSAQPYYQSPMSQPVNTTNYLPSSQYYSNDKISPSMKPQRSPQLVGNRNGSNEENLSFEGPSIPPRKVKPRYGSTSSYFGSPSLSSVSYSPRLHGLKNDEYDNYRINGRPKSMMSMSSDNIFELTKRINAANKSGMSNSGFGYRNNSRNSICSAPDLHNAYFNTSLEAIPQEDEFNNFNYGQYGKYYNRYSRSIHDDSLSEISENTSSNLRSQYGSSTSLSTLMKYDHMKIENMFMDDEVYQIGDLRDKYPLVDHSPLLSEIANDFSETISLVCHIKDNIEYLDCFSGYEAVSLLAEILGTEDRKVALQTGQVLEQYGMFHDVVYMHKLMDNKDMFYQMHTLAVPLARVATLGRINYIKHDNINDNNNNNTNGNDSDLQIKNMSELSLNSEEKKKKAEENKAPYPTGVLVNIAQCYSPTCFEDSPCYSYTCPKRRIYEKVLSKKISLDQIKTTINATLPLQTTWSTSIGKPYIKKMEKKEIKRQEIIYEFIQTEKEYVDDLYNVKKKIMDPLYEGKVSKIGEDFVNAVFSNIEELYEVNSNFYNNIRELQKRKPILESIGDIVKDFVPNLYCYITYGRYQPRAKYILQIEKNNNKNLNNFFKNAQNEPEFRRLPIESFLARPTTRLGRYPILLKDIIKNTPEGHRDIILLTDALHGIENVLKEVNNQAGKETNKLKLDEWSLLLESERKDDISMLRLENPEREFIREGKLELKRYAIESQNHSFIPITLVLLDNMLVITKPKVNTIEIYKKPIPLQLLTVIEDENNENGVESKHKKGSKNENQKNYTFTLIHQGVGSYLLQTSVYSDQKSWIECIREQQSKFKRESVTKVIPIITNPGTKIVTATYISNILLLATDNGIYVQNENKMNLILPLTKINQMELMLQFRLLFILSNKEVYPFNIDLLVNGVYSSKANLRKVKKLSSNVTFIAVGRCDDHDLLCCVKTTSLNSTIKIFEPKRDVKQNKSTTDVITLYKQFYIPSEARSITFLKKSLCIGCVKGFEVVDINTLTTQSLLSNSPRFDFVLKSDNIPIRMFRTPRQDFLLLYSKVGFYLDKNGNRSRPDIMFRWFGTPTSFAYYPPYIFSFESNSINIWEENSPEIVKQVIPSSVVKLLFENTNQILISEIKNQLQILSILQILPPRY